MSDSESKVIWQAESTDPEVADKIRQALRLVLDPELGLSVIELGLVRDLVVEDGMVRMTMILTTPFCPYGPALLEMSRQKAEEAAGMPVRIEMGMEMWDFSMMEGGAGAEWGMY